jgi:hypothetical protein
MLLFTKKKIGIMIYQHKKNVRGLKLKGSKEA